MSETTRPRTASHEAADAFLARYTAGTLAIYTLDLRLLFEWCATAGLEPLDLKRPHLERFMRHLAAPITVRPGAFYAAWRRPGSPPGQATYSVGWWKCNRGRYPVVMRVLPSTIAIAVLAFALTGCASTPEDAFMSALRADTPSILDRGTQDEAVELAHLVCDSMTRGESAHENAAMLEGIGWSVAEAGTFVIAAVENFCPEHDALIR